MKRRILAILTALILAILPATPVLAIADPDTQQVNSVFVYNSVIEDNDQIYIFEAFTDYAVPPTETLSESFLLNLIDTDGTTVVRSTIPEDPLSATGWGKHLGIIYFSASDTDLPTWGGGYTVKNAGNPTLAWPGAPPFASGAVDYWSTAVGQEDNQEALANWLLDLGGELETAWSEDIVEMTSAGEKFTATGETYFLALFSQLREAAPDAFAGSTTDPDWTGHDYGNDYADDLANNPVGTALDFSTLATAVGLSTMWMSSFLWIIFTGVIIWLAVRGAQSFKPVMLIIDLSFVSGAWLGVVPLTLPIGLAFVACLIISFFVYFRPASA